MNDDISRDDCMVCKLLHVVGYYSILDSTITIAFPVRIY